MSTLPYQSAHTLDLLYLPYHIVIIVVTRAVALIVKIQMLVTHLRIAWRVVRSVITRRKQ